MLKIFLMAFALFSFQAKATQVIAIPTREGLVVGADSKAIDPITGQFISKMQKIRKIPFNNTGFTLFGKPIIYRQKLSRSGRMQWTFVFDAFHLVTNYLKSSKGITSNSVINLAKIIDIALNRAFVISPPSLRDRKTFEGSDFLDIVIFDYDQQATALTLGLIKVKFQNGQIQKALPYLLPCKLTSEIDPIISPTKATGYLIENHKKYGKIFEKIYNKTATVGDLTASDVASFAYKVFSIASSKDKSVGPPFILYLISKAGWRKLKQNTDFY